LSAFGEKSAFPTPELRSDRHSGEVGAGYRGHFLTGRNRAHLLKTLER
jgi:hypothetical protein